MFTSKKCTLNVVKTQMFFWLLNIIWLFKNSSNRFFCVLIHIISALVFKRDEFVETTFHRQSVYFSFYTSFDSCCCVFQCWNERRNYDYRILLFSHNVKHEFCLHDDFNSFLFYLFFRTLKIKRFIKIFAKIASSF